MGAGESNRRTAAAAGPPAPEHSAATERTGVETTSPPPKSERSRLEASATLVRFPYGHALVDSPSFEPYMVEMAETHVRRACPYGYLYAEHGEVADLLLVEESHAIMAARLRDNELLRIRIAEFFRELVGGRIRRFQLCSTTPGLLALMSVGIASRPFLRVSTELVGIERILAELEVDGRDVALMLARDSLRVLAYLEAGKMTQVHYGDPARRPKAARLHDQIVATCAAGPVIVEAYGDLASRPDADAGRPFVDYVSGDVGPPPFFLTVKYGNEVLVRRLFQNGGATIGRDINNDLIVDHRSVSRRHCDIVWTGSQFVVTDCGSSNGTKVNTRRVQSAPIQLGDILSVGDFQVRFGDEPQRAERSGLRTAFIDDGSQKQHAHLVYRERVLRLDRPVFSIGTSRHASFRIKGMFIRPIQATVVCEAEGRHKLMPSAGGAKVRLRRRAVGRAGAVLESGDQFSVGRHRFVFMLSSRPD